MNPRSFNALNQRCRCGIGLRNRLLAFLCAARATMGKHRRFARCIFELAISLFANGDTILLKLAGKSAEICLLLRKGNIADYLVAGERVKGVYETAESKFQISPTKIVDGGANIGTFAAYAASLFPGVPMVCYEPDAGNANLLRKMLAYNRIPAEVIEKALWSSEGSLFFHPHESYTGNVCETPSPYPIETITVDAPDGSWLKLDIEGAEYEVLPQLIEAGRRPAVISMEVHYANQRGDYLLNILKNAGYEIFNCWRSTDSCAEITAVFSQKSS